MNKFNMTIRLTEEEVVDAIVEFVNKHGGVLIAPNDVHLKVELQSGDRPGEHARAVFENATIMVEKR